MFKNYLVVAFRNFWRHKMFSLINILGLSIGISASLVIYLIVHHEFSFDRFHKDVDRIYRVVSNLHFPGQLIQNGGVPAPLPSAAKKQITGLESSAAFYVYDYDVKVEIPGKAQEKPVVFKHQPDIIFTEGDYFDLFSYHWLSGSSKASLAEPFQVVISESRLKNYFPGVSPSEAIGRTITYNDSVKVKVSGVVRDLDGVTEFHFKDFISLATIPNSGIKNNFGWEQWGSINSASQFFVKLSDGVKPGQIEKQLASLHDEHAKNDFMKTTHHLQPLSDIHFNKDYDSFSKRMAHKPTLYGLLAVGSFLLLLGCINFINLTTANSTTRAREIGIRKTMGGSRLQLIAQFLGETFLQTTFATIISILIIPIILKVFADYIPPELRFDLQHQPELIVFICILILVVSIVSGFYPALLLSKYQPVSVLKSQVYSSVGKSRKSVIRKSLTVSQFVIAQVFIILSLLVGKQIQYSLNRDMGFRKDAILILRSPWSDRDANHRLVLLNKIKSIPEVEMASLSGSPPATQGYSSTTMKFKNGKQEIELTTEVKSADSSYLNLYGLTLVAGKWPRNSDTGITGYVVNEAFVRRLGFSDPSMAVNRILDRGNRQYSITGVIRDFHFKSTHAPIKELAYTNNSENFGTFHVLLKANPEGAKSWNRGISNIERSWKEIYPEHEFSYSFLDESIANFYKSEQQIARLLNWSMGLSIFISCLGLLGLVIYTTSQRTKEIGVRKVLGASVVQIVSLISKDFMKLVVLAFVISVPLAWLAIYNWLQNFAYRTSISWWI
ncbi:MAG TPA: ABC transporter permease, partial [Chitinophagaceae bacterium]|nr:ABC transporter permease [Chitinophagaceae bacterium]